MRFATKTLSPKDHVALEATTNTWSVVDILEPYVAKIVVSNPLKTKAITEAKVKTDKIDALILAQLLRCDFLPAVWIPDAKTRVLRRLSSFRKSLVQDVTAAKNRIGQHVCGTDERGHFCVAIGPATRQSADENRRKLSPVPQKSFSAYRV